jgi:ethanolamine-phosphate cytidylyltransferase
MTEIEVFLDTFLKLKETKIFQDFDFEKYAKLKVEKTGAETSNKSLFLQTSIVTEFTEYKKRGCELPKKKIRGLVDGVYDLTHFGHFNMLRQAQLLCDEVIVAINGDEHVVNLKGPVIMNQFERKKILDSCKFVKEVYIDPRYNLEVEDLDKYNVDFIIHGDDIVIDENGENAYSKFEKVGRLRICKRTTGISTTDIVSKLLNIKNSLFEENLILQHKNKFYHSLNNFRSFRPETSIKEGKVVYLSGSFDLLTPENVDLLEKSKKLGDYLIIGLYNDETIKNEKGEHYPILDMIGRALNLFSLKWVDDIIFDAPVEITEKFLNDNKIDIVVKYDCDYLKETSKNLFNNVDEKIIREVKPEKLFNFDTCIVRLSENEKYYEKSITEKIEKLKQYYKNEKKND